MTKQRMLRIFVPALILAVLGWGCGPEQTPIDTNLLVNGSFESFVDDVPENWRVLNFRGLQQMKPATYGQSDSLAYDGASSFYFRGESDTKRFFLLSQEVQVNNVRRVRLRGVIRWSGLKENADQYAQANFAMSFLDEGRNHNREPEDYQC